MVLIHNLQTHKQFGAQREAANGTDTKLTNTQTIWSTPRGQQMVLILNLHNNLEHTEGTANGTYTKLTQQFGAHRGAAKWY